MHIEENRSNYIQYVESCSKPHLVYILQYLAIILFWYAAIVFMMRHSFSQSPSLPTTPYPYSSAIGITDTSHP